MLNKSILLLVCLWGGQLNGQTYNPFPTDSAYWSVESRNWGLDPVWGLCTGTSHYNMLGDTVINSIQYSKIYLSTKDDGPFNIQNAMYFGALREDSLKRVYARRPTDTLERLLYDFSLNVGDTVCLDFLNLGCFPVYNVDTILFAGKQRRQIHVLLSETQKWIEGIGNRYGLFQILFVGSLSTELKCFYEKDTLLFGDSQFCHCDNLPGIKDLEAHTIDIQFNPNPIDEFGTLTIESLKHTEYLIKLYDALGREIYANRTVKKELTLGEELNSGLYYIKVWDDKKQVGTGRMIKR